MNTKYRWLPLAALSFVLIGCASNQYESASSGASNSQMQERRGDAAGKTTDPSSNAGQPLTEMKTASMQQSQRQVIRNGEISLRVKSVEETERQITKMVAAGGGYVETTSSSSLEGPNPKIDMTLRVPSTGFEDSLTTLAGFGLVTHKQVEAKDVTADIVDLSARIKTLAAKEETFREMLKQSRSLNDVMTLQDRLTEVRTEIERMDAQRKSLSELASLSTIKVSLSQNANVPTAAVSDPNWFGQSLGAATTTFVGAFQRIVALLTWAVVFSPFWVLPPALLWWLWKRWRKGAPPVAAQ